MDPTLAELSRTIDPTTLGRRLRNARIAAGMTQSQVAAEDTSTAYVSRIEIGQRRPEFGLLQRMAQRLDVPLEELLMPLTTDQEAELELDLDYGDIALRTGDAHEALKRAESVLERTTGVAARALRSRATHLRAYALEATGDIDAAITALEEITSTPSGDGLWIRATIALSRCYRESGDLTGAIEVGEEASKTIEELGLEGLTEAAQLTVTLAAAYFEHGDIARATHLCRRALADADQFESPEAKASAYWNASIIEAHQNNTLRAVELARAALAIFEAADDARAVGRLRTQLGLLQLRAGAGEAPEARETLVRARQELVWSSTTKIDLAENQLGLARAAFLLGELDDAAQQVSECLTMTSGCAPLVEAEALALNGQIAARAGDRDRALAEFQRAIHVLTGVGADRSAAQLWFELGELLGEAGDATAAGDAFRRAAVSTGVVRAATRQRSTSDR